MFRPDHPLRTRWTALVLLLIVFCAVEIPLELVFHLDDNPLWLWIDLVVSLLFLVDVAIKFNTAVAAGGRLITDRKAVAAHYFKSWFAIDFVSSLPFEILILAFDVERLPVFAVLHMLRTLRLIRLLRVGSSLLRHSRRSTLNPILLRMGFILFWVVLVSHWSACIWIELGGVRHDVPALEDAPTVACFDEHQLRRLHEDFGGIEDALAGLGLQDGAGAVCYDLADIDESAVGEDAALAIAGQASGQLRTYVRALYFVITTWATVGFGDISAITLSQTLFAILLEILGAGTFGYLVGNVASLLANLDVVQVQRQEKLARLASFVRRWRIPEGLQERVFNYYHYVWERGRSVEETEVIADLPSGLRTDVYLFLNRDILQAVPLFRGASETLIREAVQNLRPAVFTPGEYVFRKGDPGHHMYFIISGAVEIRADDPKEVFATLGPGTYFGEMALLSSAPRNANAFAAEYCDMYTLDKAAFEHLIARHPEMAEKVRALAQERASAARDDRSSRPPSDPGSR
ncbi:MAG TPA: cyclic nucleotide-binding domain-containing protein [Polyangia bacterium]|nr:cyclic nucleotide-binding domain-containing protein [Polyangia bacterium]